MRTNTGRRLRLSSETLRRLDDAEMARAEGARSAGCVTETCAPTYTCITCLVPCHSVIQVC